jgi:hypothetical protein
MPLLSYISIPYTNSANEINYIKIDLITNKVLVKDNEVLNLEELKKNIEKYEEDYKYIENKEYEEDCESVCSIDPIGYYSADHKNELINLLQLEIEKEEKNGENESYILELRETLAKMQM